MLSSSHITSGAKYVLRWLWLCPKELTCSCVIFGFCFCHFLLLEGENLCDSDPSVCVGVGTFRAITPCNIISPTWKYYVITARKKTYLVKRSSTFHSRPKPILRYFQFSFPKYHWATEFPCLSLLDHFPDR